MNPAVAWLERDYDEPGRFRPPMGVPPCRGGLFTAKDDHDCGCDGAWGSPADIAARARQAIEIARGVQ